jgi:type II secretory pathway pseudopilin PulG
MGTKTNTGFTIIETMLFLAVAGALTVGVLAGSGLAINQQRYRDSVNSLKSFIQQQYNETTNVVNDRSGAEGCSDTAAVTSPAGAAVQARGMSSCVILGRYVIINDTGTEVSASNVIGYRTADAEEKTSDIEEIKDNYKLGISTIGKDASDIAWGAVVVKKNTNDPMPLSMLILRSPLSGVIMTYTSEGVVTDLQTLVDVQNTNRALDLCVDAPASSLMGNRSAVRIGAFATNQGSVQIPPEKDNVCG